MVMIMIVVMPVIMRVIMIMPMVMITAAIVLVLLTFLQLHEETCFSRAINVPERDLVGRGDFCAGIEFRGKHGGFTLSPAEFSLDRSEFRLNRECRSRPLRTPQHLSPHAECFRLLKENRLELSGIRGTTQHTQQRPRPIFLHLN
jgi:hypothetical protein